MEFRLLGEVELRAAGQVLDVGAPRLQAVLAALVVDAGRPVAIETLIDRVWGDSPPAEVRNVLYSYLSRTRRLLRQAATLTPGTAARIERRHAGYVLNVDANLVDLYRFRRLVEQGGDRQRGDDVRANALAEALDLWRGPALAGLPGKWAGQVRDSWDRRRLDTVVQWAQLELRLGRPAAVIAVLPDLASENPLVEPLETLLMRALYDVGRGAEALDRYSIIRQRLASELGTDPGPELRALHQAVLHGALPPPRPDTVVASVRTVQPTPPQPQPATSAAEVPRHGPVLAAEGGSQAPTLAADEGPAIPDQATPDRAALDPDRTDDPQPFEASSVRIDVVTTDPPPRPSRVRLTRSHAALAALFAVILLVTIGSMVIFHRDEESDPPSVSSSVERAQALFASAQELDQDGRATDAQATVVDAVRLYDELLERNADQNAPLLAPSIIRALGRASIDFSVAEEALRTWLANPVFTPYPAISQVLLLQGWHFKSPVFLDVIVSNYEETPGITSPRKVADVKLHVLKAAVLEGSNGRHGTAVTDFEQLLEP
ncbi:AfsR/SARP family transcriptional regulator [Plantactinospora soyae]|uniref:DNA-binding SARP family transcriptional activator n=1 Tax=Plantactinospora soyae TaxID=1544732 RepID=A0A927R127_9ACTN|nr:BTAD domain-containing putative transcriptional regulator [Plantactinospora soyae]MBE1489268.1 DNA-binding SARP family transcriptional activator [Plantactinospora soyae]